MQRYDLRKITYVGTLFVGVGGVDDASVTKALILLEIVWKAVVRVLRCVDEIRLACCVLMVSALADCWLMYVGTIWS